MPRINVKLPEALHKKLRHKMVDKGWTLEKTVVEALKKYLKGEGA